MAVTATDLQAELVRLLNLISVERESGKDARADLSPSRSVLGCVGGG